jgi:hypothetical protein
MSSFLCLEEYLLNNRRPRVGVRLEGGKWC